jgi:hypothetical protein
MFGRLIRDKQETRNREGEKREEREERRILREKKEKEGERKEGQNNPQITTPKNLSSFLAVGAPLLREFFFLNRACGALGPPS